MQRTIFKPRRGFTLIELLITLVVLGVLFTLGLFLFNNVRDSGHHTAAQADVRASLIKATNGYTRNSNSFGSTTSEAITQLEDLGSDGLSYTSNDSTLGPQEIFVQLDDATTSYPGSVGQQITLCSQSQASTPRVYCMRVNQEEAFPVSYSSSDTPSMLISSTRVVSARGPNVPDTVCALPQPGPTLPDPWPPAGCPGIPAWGAGSSGPSIEVFTIGGWGGVGELGRGTTDPSPSEFVPIYTEGHVVGRTFSDIAAGHIHMCGIADNEVFCWGDNGIGELGDGSTSGSYVPVPVDDTLLAGREITQISSNSNHTCVIADGDAFCWGQNDGGQTGHGVHSPGNDPLINSPVAVTGELTGRNVTHISTGVGHTCAVADGNAYCWGWGWNGRLGNNSTLMESAPVAVDTTGVLSGRTVTQIETGFSHTCAIADGEVFCWGWGGDGRLGNDVDTGNHLVPVAVNTDTHLNGRTVTEIGLSQNGSCALSDGDVFCWGTNNGDGTANSSLVPTPLDMSGGLAGKEIVSVSGWSDNFVITDEGELFTWGNMLVSSHTPIPAHPFTDGIERPVRQISFGSMSGIVIAETPG